MSVRIKVDSRAFRSAAKAMPKVWAREARKAMAVGGGLFKAEFFKRRAARKRSATGEMSRSYRAAVSEIAGRGLDLRVGIYGLPYPRVIEEGGTIVANGNASTPRGTGRMLAIPLGPAKTRAGVARGTAGLQPGLFLIKSRRGNLLLVKRSGKGKNAGIVPWYVLKRSVKIPPSLTFRRSFKDYGHRLILERLEAARAALAAKWKAGQMR